MTTYEFIKTFIAVAFVAGLIFMAILAVYKPTQAKDKTDLTYWVNHLNNHYGIVIQQDESGHVIGVINPRNLKYVQLSFCQVTHRFYVDTKDGVHGPADARLIHVQLGHMIAMREKLNEHLVKQYAYVNN